MAEVASLEDFLSNERNLVVDRFAAGCFLFALYSRSRWSDLLIPVSYFLESGHFGHLCSGRCRADLVPEQLMIIGKFVFRRFHFEIV